VLGLAFPQTDMISKCDVATRNAQPFWDVMVDTTRCFFFLTVQSCMHVKFSLKVLIEPEDNYMYTCLCCSWLIGHNNLKSIRPNMPLLSQLFLNEQVGLSLKRLFNLGTKGDMVKSD
jgi:hypothetical protein